MQKKWCLDDFDYILPEELIADYPLPERSKSRLMCLDRETGQVRHRLFSNLVDLLNPGDLVVLNDTKVIPARLLGYKASGGQVECLIERVLGEHLILAHIRASKSPRAGQLLIINENFKLKVLGREEDLFRLEIEAEDSIWDLLEKFGQIPLPPYISRLPEKIDQSRYQTIFAEQWGAVAAPTAGLHFDHQIIEALKAKQILFATLTLHVGAGTFQPIRVQNIYEHRMHSEYLQVSLDLCRAVEQCHARARRVIAIGTTVMRGLETAAQSGRLLPFTGETRLFIYPGFRFQCVDALVTNFHIPRSSLLMLVCAFGGYEAVMRAYHEAVEKKYRFFSYGDAMFVAYC